MDKILVEYNSLNGIFFQHRILDREYVVKTSSHAQYEFVCLIKGKMELDVEGQACEVEEGGIALLDANVLHSQRMFAGTETELMVLSFLPSALPSIVKYGFMRTVAESPLLMHRLSAEVVEKNYIAEYFEKISIICEEQDLPYKDLHICSELVKLVALISEAVDEVVKLDNVQMPRSNKAELVSKCIDYLNSNLTKKIGIEQIAESLCCSKSYLQHVFKKEMKMSISDYINTQKMTIAKSLLISGLTPSEVADKLGYEYYSTFSAKFKKFYGYSPKAINLKTMSVNVDIERGY